MLCVSPEHFTKMQVGKYTKSMQYNMVTRKTVMVISIIMVVKSRRMVMMVTLMMMVVTRRRRMVTVILMPIWRQADKLPVSKSWEVIQYKRSLTIHIGI